ncbi:hypothetical protein FQZ97_915820 [compost metagenome]
MSMEINDYVSVAERLNKFNVSAPSGLAILPHNLATAASREELRQHAESDTVRTLFFENNITCIEIFDEDNQPPYLQQYGFEWFGPTIFISAGFILQNPNILSVSLGLITNYLYDLFKGTKDGKASLNVIFQKADGSCKEIRYSGSPEGLKSIADIVRELGEE